MRLLVSRFRISRDLSRASSFSSLQTRTTSSGNSPFGSQAQEAMGPVCIRADATDTRLAENYAALRNLRREISALGGESVTELSGVHAQKMRSFGNVSSDLDSKFVAARQHAINGAGSRRTREEELLLWDWETNKQLLTINFLLRFFSYGAQIFCYCR